MNGVTEMNESGVDLNFDLFDLDCSVFDSALDFLEAEGKDFIVDGGFYELKSKNVFDVKES